MFIDFYQIGQGEIWITLQKIRQFDFRRSDKRCFTIILFGRKDSFVLKC